MQCVKLPFRKRAIFVSHDASWPYRTQPLRKTENTCGYEHLCMHVGWFEGRGYSGAHLAEWGHIHAQGKKPLLRGRRASGHQWDAQAQSHTGRDSPPQLHHCSERFHSPQAGKASSSSSIKSFVKSFHPVPRVLGPLTWVDILICCRKTVTPLCQRSELHRKTRAVLMTLMLSKKQKF